MQFLTPQGWYSAAMNIHADRDTHPVSIRARKLDHLERLIKESGIQGKIVDTSHTGSDYPFRLLLRLQDWFDLARWLAEEAAERKNVKSAIAAAFGHGSPEARFAMRVWSEGRSLEVRSKS